MAIIWDTIQSSSSSIPSWYRTPRSQTIALGIVFFLLFSAYGTIQFYAASNYGAILAANSVSAIYGSLTLSCIVAPSFTHKWGSQWTMAIGVLGGYVTFVVFSLLYFEGYVGSWIVVLGGIMVGIGAALLWTAQGRLILEYVSVADKLAESTSTSISGAGGAAPAEEEEGDGPPLPQPSPTEPQSGRLLGLFWGIFKANSLLGGTLAFVYYSRQTTTTTSDDASLPITGNNTKIYLIFLSLMILSAIMTQLLLSPKSLLYHDHDDSSEKPPNNNRVDDNVNNDSPPTETTTLLLVDESNNNNNNRLPPPQAPAQEEEERRQEAGAEAEESSSWLEEAKETILLFTKNRSLQELLVIFFYTGYNQPYQQATYTRFFSKRTIGIQLLIFRILEIVGAILSGRLLDKESIARRNTRSTTTTEDNNNMRTTTINARKRRSALVCLGLFLLVNGIGNLIAIYYEFLARDPNNHEDIFGIDVTSPNWRTSFLLPSCAFVCWGYADSQIQVYCYWLLGTLFDGRDKTRAVAFYKCLQSLGYTVGFYLIPTATRCSGTNQILLSTGFFLGGTFLALLQLPPP